MSASEMDHPEAGNAPSRLAAMPGARRRAILAVALAAALGALAGCGGSGGDGGIPPESADTMLAIADEIQAANDEGDCETAQRATTELRNEVDELGGGETKEALDAMVTRLDENIDEECAESGTTDEAEPETTTSVPVEPTTTTPTTTTTTTAPPEDEEPETPEQPQGEGGGPNGPPQNPPGGGGGAPPTGGLEDD